MTLPGAPPPDPTNRVGDDPRAAVLGEALFRDGALSSNGALSCADCHRDEHDLADGRPVGLGLRELDRNVPSVRLSAHFRWQFWDGRADSLWSQALGPMENPDEMNGARTDVARRAATAHRAGYTAVFGAPPPFDDLARFPRGARPGTAAWEAMRDEDRALVDRAFANVGKAMAAYERTLRAPRTAFDRYLAGDFAAMSTNARQGLRTYLDAGCAQCHFGPHAEQRQLSQHRHAHGPPRRRARPGALVQVQPPRLGGVARALEVGELARALHEPRSAPG
jgi:cytochrome c peroxidase